jgi:hypothetical protein
MQMFRRSTNRFVVFFNDVDISFGVNGHLVLCKPSVTKLRVEARMIEPISLNEINYPEFFWMKMDRLESRETPCGLLNK